MFRLPWISHILFHSHMCVRCKGKAWIIEWRNLTKVDASTWSTVWSKWTTTTPVLLHVEKTLSSQIDSSSLPPFSKEGGTGLNVGPLWGDPVALSCCGLCCGWAPHIPSERGFITDTYKFIKCLLYPLMKRFYRDGSNLFQHDNDSHPWGSICHWIVWEVVGKWHKPYAADVKLTEQPWESMDLLESTGVVFILPLNLQRLTVCEEKVISGSLLAKFNSVYLFTRSEVPPIIKYFQFYTTKQQKCYTDWCTTTIHFSKRLFLTAYIL